MELITSLYVKRGLIPYEKWMIILDIGYVIDNRYNVVSVHLSRLESWTFFPLKGTVPTKSRLISVGLVNENHFVQVYNIY